jgi:nucleoside-diphosphate-sugar epimerase
LEVVLKILVTGATGFIGSHLVEKLVQEGYSVKALVLPDPIERIEPENLELLKKLKVELVYGDIRDKGSLEMIFDDVEKVFHLAAISRPMNVPDQLYFDTNELGTKNLLELAYKNNIKNFIHVSTVSVLGTSKDGKPLKEQNYREPDGLYGLSKLKAEEAVIDFINKYNFPAIILRPSLIYGPRCLVRLVMFDFIRKRLFPVFGDGSSKMEFCYVENLVQALLAAKDNNDLVGKVYNITDGESYEIRQVINTIAEELGVGYPWLKMPVWLGISLGLLTEVIGKIFNFHPPFSRTAAEWMSRDMNVYDCSKAKSEIPYKPGVSLREGIRRTISWYKDKNLLK